MTLTVNGVSKAYAMTGWRIGYAGGPNRADQGDEQDPVAVHVKSVILSGVGAAVGGLTGPNDYIAERNKVFQERRDLVVKMLNEAEG